MALRLTPTCVDLHSSDNRPSMRRIFLSALLLVVMLLSQQGAVLHEIGHLTDEASQQSQHHHPAGEKFCVTCLAFAAIGGAAAQGLPTLALLDARFAVPKAEVVRVVAAEPPSHRSRGPPLVS